LIRLLKRADFQMLTIVLILCVIGSVAIYSCTKSDMVKAGRAPTAKLKLQLVWLVLGLAALLGTMMMDAVKLGRLAIPIYAACMGLLLIVLVLGPIRGTTRWISLGPLNLQPAELAKLGVILMLGAILARAEEQSWDFLFLVRTLAYVMAPVFLILLQPDLGTPIVLFFVWLVMMYVFGGNPMHLAAFALAAILLFAGAWGFGLIRPHQKQRMISFMDPSADPLGSGYHLSQSLIAIGSGHLWGHGLFHGPQSQGSFIPDQETDFIFTVVGEEMGFVGATCVVLLYGLLLYRGLAVAAAAPGMFGRVVATGVTAMLLLQVVANIGMTIGMAPVKGMALPFLSYGGSSLVSSMIAVGILQSIYMRRDPIVF